MLTSAASEIQTDSSPCAQTGQVLLRAWGGARRGHWKDSWRHPATGKQVARELGAGFLTGGGGAAAPGC